MIATKYPTFYYLTVTTQGAPMRLVENAPRPPRRRHPYDEMLDGNTWELVKGEDYHCTTKSFRNQIYSEAARRGGSASIQEALTADDRECVLVTFIPPLRPAS